MFLSETEDDFINQLQAKGVSTVKRESEKYGAYYTYELTDTSAIPEGTKLPNHALKIRSYKLGSDFGPAALDKQIEFNKRFSNTSLNNENDIGKLLETDEVFDEILSKKSSETDVSETKDEEYSVPIAAPDLYDEPADYSGIRARLLLEAEDEEEKVKIKVKKEVASKNTKQPVIKKSKTPKAKPRKPINGARFDSDTEMAATSYAKTARKGHF